MSGSNPLLKPPVLFVGVVLIALIALSAGLRKQAEEPLRGADKEEQTEIGRLDTGATRVSHIDAPSVSSHLNRSSGPGASAGARKGPRKQIVEDFETALRRADGDMYITGKVLGSDRNSYPDRPGRDSNGNRWRERWARSNPVESAHIFLYEDDPNTTHPPLRTAVTDKEGSFTLANLNGANQRFIMVVKADKFAPEATFVSINNEPRDISVSLEPGVGSEGKVVDAETSEPIAGAVVYHPNPRWQAFAPLGVTTTSINGEFKFTNVHPGRRLMTQANADGYATKRAVIEAPENRNIIRMQPGGASISGVTIDRLTGKPQGGARVWAVEDRRDVSESVLSAEDGSFKLENLPGGEFEVYAVRGMKSEIQILELERQQQIKDVEITLPAELLVSGQVVHSTQRKPLDGIKVWYQSAKGAQYRTTNADGRFAFETMAVDEYALLIHEKGYLPVNEDKKSTESSETIIRKVAKNQSSDEVTIRLRPVPTLEGHVASGRNRGGRRSSGQSNGNSDGDKSVNGAEVKLSYLQGRQMVELETKSDPAGNFFFNLPKGQRGEGIVVATHNYAIDAKEVRVPRKNPIKLKLQQNFVFGRLLLVDESSLDGVPIDVSLRIPKNRSESGSSHRVKLADINSLRGGRVMMGLPRDQNVELSFSMPDGVTVSKEFKSDRLLDSRPIFIYDPVSQDIIADTTPRENRRRDGQRNRADGEKNPDKNGNKAGRQNGGKNQNQPVKPAAAPAPAK